MHDLSLGRPVRVEDREGKVHDGPCYDGVYGCHRCWNADNDGQGSLATCDGCQARNVLTVVTQAWDEPVLYAWCKACRKRQNDELRAMDEEDER